MFEYPQTVGDLTAMGQNLYDLIKSGDLIAYADDDLTAANLARRSG